ncbi:hypothetical protein BJ875DRAFT_346912, partial [Amylocarpus encephaloides]
RKFNWLARCSSNGDMTPFQKFTLDVDWKNSPLGPINQWPHQLKQMVLLLEKDITPAT